MNFVEWNYDCRFWINRYVFNIVTQKLRIRDQFMFTKNKRFFMKRYNIAAFLFLFITVNIYSQHSGSGLGIMIGEPTGLSGKHWLNGNNALAGGLAWHFAGPNDGVSLHLDYLYHIDNSFQPSIQFPLYYGFGARIRDVGGDFGMGFRGVGGILFYPSKLPIDIFFELVPVFTLLPETDLELDLAVGARYYFH